MQEPYIQVGLRMALRPVRKSDAVLFREWQADLMCLDLLQMETSRETEGFATIWDSYLQRTLTMVIVRLPEERALGFAQGYNFDLSNSWCFALTYLSESNRSHQIGLEASAAFWDYLFAHLNLRKVYFAVSDRNSAWLDAVPLREIGLFIEEGRYERHFCREGQCWNELQYALYRNRWIERRRYLLSLFGLGTFGGTEEERSVESPVAGVATGRPASAASRLRHLGKQYLSRRKQGQFPQLMNMLSHEVVYDSPITGVVVGKQAVEELLRFRHRLLLRAAGRPLMPSIVWGAPQLRDSALTVAGSRDGSAPITLTWEFDSDQRISKIRSMGPPELVALYLAGDEPPL